MLGVRIFGVAVRGAARGVAVATAAEPAALVDAAVGFARSVSCVLPITRTAPSPTIRETVWSPGCGGDDQEKMVFPSEVSGLAYTSHVGTNRPRIGLLQHRCSRRDELRHCGPHVTEARVVRGVVHSDPTQMVELGILQLESLAELICYPDYVRRISDLIDEGDRCRCAVPDET